MKFLIGSVLAAFIIGWVALANGVETQGNPVPDSSPELKFVPCFDSEKHNELFQDLGYKYKGRQNIMLQTGQVANMGVFIHESSVILLAINPEAGICKVAEAQ